MSTPWRHHYVPELLLKGFADGDGRLWSATREFAGHLKSYAPREIFWERDFYRIDWTNNDPVLVERAYAFAEGRSAEVLDELRAVASGEQSAELLEVDKVRLFVADQWARTPAMRALLMREASSATQLRTEDPELAYLRLKTVLGEENLPGFVLHGTEDVLGSEPNLIILATLNHARMLARELEHFKMWLVRVHEPVVVSDNPVVLNSENDQVGSQLPALSSLKSLFLPISSNAVLQCVRDPENSDSWGFLEASLGAGFGYNHALAVGAKRIAGSSRRMVLAIAARAWPDVPAGPSGKEWREFIQPPATLPFQDDQTS